MERLDLKKSALLVSLPEIAHTMLGVRVSECRFIGGGSNGKVFRAKLPGGESIALKAYRRQGAQNEEAYQLKMLSKYTSVTMPEVLFTYADAETAVMGMSLLAGRNVLNPVFLLRSQSQKAAFAGAVVRGMAEWHSVRGEKYGDLEQPAYTSWREYYRREKQEPWLKGLAALCEQGKFSRMRYDLLCRATELFEKVYEEPEAPVLIHGDLNIMNMMADPEDLTLCGFIDPCGSLWADREYDLFQLENMWGNCFGLYGAYKALRPLSVHTDFRVAYYGAMNEAACRLGSGAVFPVWEDLWDIRLKKAMKKQEAIR